MCEYGGYTYKSDFQMLAFLGTLSWGTRGIKRLETRAIENGEYRAINNVTRFLSHLSSKTLDLLPSKNEQLESVKVLELSSEKYKTIDWTTSARESLVQISKSVEIDDLFPMGILINMGFGINQLAQEHIFAALMARWFNFNSNGIDAYAELITSVKDPEIVYQNYLKNNPYLLEPFHAQIWSKPRFGEALVPDFLIQSMDNSYTIVEIERPDFQILTQDGELSAKTTHAKRQAMDFRDWAINNSLYANKRFPHMYRPYCLVVIGRESELNEMQINRLKQENESTQGVLRIVGFDWLYNRAKYTFENLLKYGFDRGTLIQTINE
jgi:hypothetical protein